MELGAAPQRTAALEPLSLLNSAAPESLSGQSDGDSVGAIRGGAVEPLPSNEQEHEEVFPMGWGAERGQAVKPPRSSGPLSADSAFKGGVAAAAAPDRMRLSGAGDVGDSVASDVAVVQNQPSGSAVVIEGPTSLTPYGLSAKAPGSFGAQRLKRELRQAASGELATPLASAGAGDVGAECDATPLQSRPPRDNSSGSQGGGGGSFSLAALLGASGIGRVETASEGAGSTSASGLEECSSSGEGRGVLKRKDTITWESFLAGMSVGSGTEEGGGAAKEASASDSSSPAESRQPPEASMERPEAEGHPRPGAGAEQPSTVRTRYLRAMASNAGAVPWNNNTDDDDDGDDESGDTTDGGGGFRGLPELSEGHAMNTAHIPRLLSDLSDRTFSPRSRHLDLGRSQSLSSVGLGSINNVRKTMERGINKFNVNPKDGIAFLIENGLMTDTAEQICDFLSTAEGLSKRRIGEYFGRDNPKVQEVLRLFLRKLNFKDASLDEALRSMVVRFRLPGEAQQMDRIMESFAVRYHEENPGVFSCSDTAWVLAFGLMMLNTDMYNRNIKESDKMTEAQFVKNHRGIDKGQDPPKELLEGMYRRIKASEIRMDEGDMYESEVITFVAPKKSGWLKKKSTGYVGKWKRHWFVLNDAVLYYFIAPQHQDEAPRCIIPLEGINISPVGATDLSIGLRTNQGYVKSVKMADNGIMQQGQHRSFVLRAESMAERDIWVEALRAEVPAFHMELSTTRSLSATPATSSAPTPVGTPSESGRRTSKFGASGRDRRRRATVDVDASSQMPRPVLRGWARTQSEQHQSGSRRYIALFRNVGPNLRDNVIYFFGDTAMCDKMIGQQLRTSHGCLTLSDVTRLQVGEEQGSGGGKAIALYTGTGKNVKEMIIVPEEQREFLSWTRLIKECCPDSAYSIAADGVPIMSSTGDALFTSVADSERDGLASSASRPVSIADQGSMDNGQEGVFLATGIPSTVEGAAGTADNKGREDSVGSDVYVRSESSVTQPVGVGGGDSRGQREMGRMITTASSVTEADHPTEPEEVGGDRDGDPRSPTGPRPTLTARESSTPGTDVE